MLFLCNVYTFCSVKLFARACLHRLRAQPAISPSRDIWFARDSNHASRGRSHYQSDNEVNIVIWRSSVDLAHHNHIEARSNIFRCLAQPLPELKLFSTIAVLFGGILSLVLNGRLVLLRGAQRRLLPCRIQILFPRNAYKVVQRH